MHFSNFCPITAKWRSKISLACPTYITVYDSLFPCLQMVATVGHRRRRRDGSWSFPSGGTPLVFATFFSLLYLLLTISPGGAKENGNNDNNNNNRATTSTTTTTTSTTTMPPDANSAYGGNNDAENATIEKMKTKEEEEEEEEKEDVKGIPVDYQVLVHSTRLDSTYVFKYLSSLLSLCQW